MLPPSSSESLSSFMLFTEPSPVHPASLVDPSLHSPVLLQLVGTKISRQLVDYVVQCVVGGSSSCQPELVKFANFVANVLTWAQVTTPVVLVSLVYIVRAKPHLHIRALEEEASEHTLDRAFLGALIIASKYLNNCTLDNVHWAMCTGVFGNKDVEFIEREFLNILDWELSRKCVPQGRADQRDEQSRSSVATDEPGADNK
ncbi:hypothetical protein BT96DRAFT_1016869, partial [Gymnopus androsaceus JB14]